MQSIPRTNSCCRRDSYGRLERSSSSEIGTKIRTDLALPSWLQTFWYKHPLQSGLDLCGQPPKASNKVRRRRRCQHESRGSSGWRARRSIQTLPRHQTEQSVMKRNKSHGDKCSNNPSTQPEFLGKNRSRWRPGLPAAVLCVDPRERLHRMWPYRHRLSRCRCKASHNRNTARNTNNYRKQGNVRSR